MAIGNLSVTPRFYGAVGANKIPPIIGQYLTGIRISGPATISVKKLIMAYKITLQQDLLMVYLQQQGVLVNYRQMVL